MTHPVPRRTALRSSAAVALAAAVGGAAASCSVPPDTSGSGDPPTPTPAPHEVRVRPGAEAAPLDPDLEASLAASRALLARATAVVLVAPAAVEPGTSVATALGIPLLVWGGGVREEMDRLGTRTVLRVVGPTPTASSTPVASASPGGSVPDDLGDRELVDVGDGPVPDIPGLPLAPPRGRVLALTRAGRRSPVAAEATLRSVGARRIAAATEDLRESEATWAPLRELPDALVIGVTEGLGPAGHFAQRVRTVLTADQLPGGGFLPFPGRRMVALYGHPSTTDLGMLGEQSATRSVARAESLVAQYAALSEDLFVPAFEIIATVASGSAGSDGQYSRRTPIRVLLPWVDAAARAGVYVVLDLQPGRSDFLTQARAYEPLLRRPHVGLALDPEWRLRPDQVHLRQVGSVGIDEVNAVGTWLAGLVRDHDLPPKVLTLHQFSLAMIRGRARLDTSLDEVQWLVHADGQGSQPAKQATWAALRRDLPDGVWLGWKNFEDEDHPMLTPAQTLATVHPTPSFISYQ